MSASVSSNLSPDIVWAIVRKFWPSPESGKAGAQDFVANIQIQGNNHSYISKNPISGGAQFSRDPLNLTNRNTRKVRYLCYDRHSHLEAEANMELACGLP